MKKLSVLLLSGLMISLPIISLAATYRYLDSRGTWQSVEANNAAQALVIADTRGNIANGGVMLDQSANLSNTAIISTAPTGTASAATVVVVAGNYALTYRYVDISGNVKTVTAVSLAAAMADATDADPHSGFMVVG